MDNIVILNGIQYYVSTVLAETIGIPEQIFIRTLQTNFPNQIQAVVENKTPRYYLVTRETATRIPSLFNLDEKTSQRLTDLMDEEPEPEPEASTKSLAITSPPDPAKASELTNLVDVMMTRHESVVMNLMRESHGHVERVIEAHEKQNHAVLDKLTQLIQPGTPSQSVPYDPVSSQPDAQARAADRIKTLVIESTGMAEEAYDQQYLAWLEYYRNEFPDWTEAEVIDETHTFLLKHFLNPPDKQKN